MKTKLNIPRKKKKEFIKWIDKGGFNFTLNPNIERPDLTEKEQVKMVLEDLYVLHRTIKYNQGKTTFTTKGL